MHEPQCTRGNVICFVLPLMHCGSRNARAAIHKLNYIPLVDCGSWIVAATFKFVAAPMHKPQTTS